MYILENQTCLNCSEKYDIVSKHHFRSFAFPYNPFCSKKCEEEYAKKRAGENGQLQPETAGGWAQ